MSLINRMLRDLDARRAAESPGGEEILAGIRPVPATRSVGGRRWLWLVVLLSLVLLAALAWWWRDATRQTTAGGGGAPAASAPLGVAPSARPLLRSLLVEPGPGGSVRLRLRFDGQAPPASLQRAGERLVLRLDARGHDPAGVGSANAGFAGLEVRDAEAEVRVSWRADEHWRHALLPAQGNELVVQADPRPRPVVRPNRETPPPRGGAHKPQPAAAKRSADEVRTAPQARERASAETGGQGERARIRVRVHPPGPGQRAAEARHAAARALAEGRRDEALARWREATTLEPGNAENWLGLARLLVRDGRKAEATAVLRQGVEQVPRDIRLRGLLARLLAEFGNVEEALKVLPEAVAERDAELLGMRAALLQKLGRLEASRHAYVAALTRRPGHAPWWAGLALVLEAEGRHAAALEAWHRTLRLPGLDDAARAHAQERIRWLKRRLSAVSNGGGTP